MAPVDQARQREIAATRDDAVALRFLLQQVAAVAQIASEPDWTGVSTGLVGLAQSHRVLGILPQAPGWERLPVPVRDNAQQVQRRVALQMMAAAARQAAVLTRLQDAGHDVVVLKGTALSQQLYGRWDARGRAADLDVLIDPAAVPDVNELLVGMGYSCPNDRGKPVRLLGRRGAYQRWLHYERGYRGGGLPNVDMHWRLLPGGAAWSRFDAVWRERAQANIPGAHVHVPGSVHRTVICLDQGESDGWVNLRQSVDALVSWRLCGQQQRDSVRRIYPSADRALRVAGDRLTGAIEPPGTGMWEGPDRIARSRNLWSARRRSGNWLDASVRSLLGTVLPAHRLSGLK